MTGKWSQLQRCDSLRRAFTHSAKHVLDSSCHDCMDGADCMTKQARGLCLDCMDGADCRKAPGCPGELDGGAHSSKLHSSSSEQTTVLYLKIGPSKNGRAQPPPNRAQPNTVTVIIYIFRCIKYSRPTPAQPLRPTPLRPTPPRGQF